MQPQRITVSWTPGLSGWVNFAAHFDHTTESETFNHLTSKSAPKLFELSTILRKLRVNETFWRLAVNYRLTRMFDSLKSILQLLCSSARGHSRHREQVVYSLALQGESQ
jgi:hypothetical protein